jgi:hypothetical protein
MYRAPGAAAGYLCVGMTGVVEALIVVSAAEGAFIVYLAARRSLRALPWLRVVRQRAAHRRAASGFLRLSSWKRASREFQLAVTPHGSIRDARVLRMRLVNAMEQAGTAAKLLVKLDRIDPQMAVLIRRLRDLGVKLDRRLVFVEAIRDQRLLVPEISNAATSVQEVERMASALGGLAAAMAGGTIDLEAAQLRRELELEVNALHAGLRAYRDLEEPITEAASAR